MRPASHSSRYEVDGLPLAQILDEDTVARTGLIKIDVEGAEHIVLAYIAALIPRLHPRCERLVELTPAGRSPGATIAALLAPFLHKGFRGFVIPNPYDPPDVVAFLAHPRRLAPLVEPITAQTDVLLTREAGRLTA
ncbi:FkbM family methyltransferase [Nocardia rhizosphaerae]|uniref:FkbM family methyltransferase n=1 Tax=Nocardia rhizosphaerae TaxID=1691571 RepID=A0ABV8L680_9NOCA